MIKPHPESDMRLNIMVLGTDIIAMLNSKANKNKFVLVESLLTQFLKRDEKRSPDLFIYTLTFLYSVGLIEHKGYKVMLTPKIEQQQQNLFEYNVDQTLLQ